MSLGWRRTTNLRLLAKSFDGKTIPSAQHLCWPELRHRTWQSSLFVSPEQLPIVVHIESQGRLTIRSSGPLRCRTVTWHFVWQRPLTSSVMLIRSGICVLLLCTLLGCTSPTRVPSRYPPGPWHVNPDGTADISPADRARCDALQGSIQPVLFSTIACVYPALDAGKSCTDRSQCEGSCSTDRDAPAGTRIMGKCSRLVGARGCDNLIHNGIVSGYVCTD